MILGDPSIDSHARFNLSPVPSVEGDDDNNDDEDGVGHPTRQGLSTIDQNDSEEENDLTPGRTTVRMVDSPSSPTVDRSDNQS